VTVDDLVTGAGVVSTVLAALVMVKASWRLNTARVWKEEAEAQKTRADRLFDELEEVKYRLTELESYTRTLVHLLSTVDPQALDEIRMQRGI